MLKTTICYIEKDNKYLMLHRTKKKNDMSHDLYLGIGGKFEPGESADECNAREVLEETGLILRDAKLRGLMYFVSDKYDNEAMYIYTATDYDGQIDPDCDEGDLVWIDRTRVFGLPIWEGDKIFFKLLEEDAPFFYIMAHYDADNRLIDHKVDTGLTLKEAEAECGC